MSTTPKAAGQTREKLNKKGFTFIELVVAMAISAILGVMLVSTLHTGLRAYKGVSEDMLSETQARTALSLITVQIRKHDQTGAISCSTDLDGVPTMYFYEDPLDTDSYTKITFVKPVPPEAEGAVTVTEDIAGTPREIARVRGLTITESVNQYGAPMFTVTVEYGDARVLTQSVMMRSAPEGTP